MGDVGRYSGWGHDEELPKGGPPEQRHHLAFMRYEEDNVWRDRLGCLYLPAMVVLITVEDWLHVPQVAGWISLVGLFAFFMLIARIGDRVDRRSL